MAVNIEHARIPLRRSELASQKIKSARCYSTSAARYSIEKHKAVILHAERITPGASGIRAASLTGLQRSFDEGQVVEPTLVICMANFTNRFNDGLSRRTGPERLSCDHAPAAADLYNSTVRCTSPRPQ